MKPRSKLSAWNLDCRAASQLASDSLDRELTRGERIALRFHQLVCPPCRHLVSQFQVIRRAVASLRSPWLGGGNQDSVELSAERRAAIKKVLQEAHSAEEDR
jgi:hypothetical protein